MISYYPMGQGAGVLSLAVSSEAPAGAQTQAAVDFLRAVLRPHGTLQHAEENMNLLASLMFSGPFPPPSVFDVLLNEFATQGNFPGWGAAFEYVGAESLPKIWAT